MRLLVSVVSPPEAAAALAGGADIVDVKDPREGPLGAPSPAVLEQVVALVGGRAPVSVALGDVPAQPHTAALAARGAASAGADYVKAGLGHLADVPQAVAVLAAIREAVGAGVGVIAAAYADAAVRPGLGPAPDVLPSLVAGAGISGALVDTCVKDGTGLYGWLTVDAVRALVARTRAAGGTCGLAGQLTLAQLGLVEADLVGVRSAVCDGGDRAGALDADLVARAARSLHG